MKREIEAMQPDVIVPAGSVAFSFLRYFAVRTVSSEVGDVVFHVQGIPVVYAPFFTGNGRRDKEAFERKARRTKETLEAVRSRGKIYYGEERTF
ncbi:hypothetical protein MO973_06690 [Paenibacillus sp. TRM 82003]|nr:hypothetical protein [Paenibacillus sp. TRM 82003]